MSATHHPSHSTPVTIIETVLIGSWVHLYGCPQDGWWLYWSDGVANDWTEHYTELSHALLHVASLVYCGEHDYRRSPPRRSNTRPAPDSGFGWWSRDPVNRLKWT
jgi:hypothetical protein